MLYLIAKSAIYVFHCYIYLTFFILTYNITYIVNGYREVYSLHWYASRLRCVQTPWHPLHKIVLYMGDVPQLLTLVKPYTVGFTICTPGVHFLLGYLLTYFLCAPGT